MLKYPDRFSLPGEIEIKKTISTLAPKKRREGKLSVIPGKDNNVKYMNVREISRKWLDIVGKKL